MCYMARRTQVGVREIRQNLSVYLDRVRKGEALEITDRGQPVALLGPLPERSSVTQRLVAEGRLRPPSGRWERVPPRVRMKPGHTMQEILHEMRQDRF